MVRVIEKEVSSNIKTLTDKTEKLGIQLLSFVMSCWIILGTVVIGIGGPVYLVKSLMELTGPREAEASVTLSQRVLKPNLTVQNKWRTSNPRYLTQTRSPNEPITLRQGLHETRYTVNELRRFARVVTSMVNR